MNRREQYERSADRIRAELLVTLAELDRRRHESTDVKAVARKNAPLLIGAGVAVAGVVGGLAALSTWRVKHRKRIRFEKRWEGLRRAWDHPERLAVRSEDRPLPFEITKKLALAFGLAFGTQLAKRTAQALLPASSRASPVR